MPEVRVVIPNDLDRALEALVKTGFAGNKAELARTAIAHFLSTVPTQLQKGYDLENAFSPDGRVFQLEYAQECTNHGGTGVGICCNEGLVLAKEVRQEYLTPYTIIPNLFVQIFKICEHIGLTYSGLLTDGYLIVENAIKQAELLAKESQVDIEVLAKKLVLFMQPYSQRKDVRPLGVALLLGGIDREDKPRLFLLGGEGLSQEYRACVVGIGGKESKGILKGGYKPDLNLKEATILAIKATLREKKMPENVLVATIDAKTGKFRNVTMKEKERMWNKIFS